MSEVWEIKITHPNGEIFNLIIEDAEITANRRVVFDEEKNELIPDEYSYVIIHGFMKKGITIE